MNTVQNLDAAIKASESSCANNLCTANDSSTINSSDYENLQDANPESFISTSDCSALSSPYIQIVTSTGLTSSKISFNAKCDADYNDPDAGFMTVAVFTFEDCIAACASYNEVRFSRVLVSQLRQQSRHGKFGRPWRPQRTQENCVEVLGSFSKNEY